MGGKSRPGPIELAYDFFRFLKGPLLVPFLLQMQLDWLRLQKIKQ